MDAEYDDLAFPGTYASSQKDVKFVGLGEIQTNFGPGNAKRRADHRRRAQDKLLGCAYYAGGNMHGVQKLYDKVRRVQVDRGQPLTAGDRVQILGAPEVLVVGEVRGKAHVLERRSTGKQLKRTYTRGALTLTHGITRDRVTQFLEQQTVYQLSRRPRRIKQFRAVVPRSRRSLVQIDLIGPMTHKTVCVDRYALVGVDILTRKAWTAVLRDKEAATVGRAFARMLADMTDDGTGQGKAFESVPKRQGVREVLVSSDNGTEFSGSEFMTDPGAWAQANGIELRQVFGIPGVANSQAYVERANQSIKGILYRLLNAHRNRCFSSFLARATRMYNDAIHTAIGMTPNKAERSQRAIRRQLLSKLKRQQQTTYAQEQRGRLKKGDAVRVFQLKTSIQHRYYNNWREPVFRVAEVLEPPSPVDVIRYTLEAMQPGDPSESIIRSGTKDSPGPRYRYKRNMLLRIPSGTPLAPPSEPTTFKAWCTQCEDSCLDYKAFAEQALAQSAAAKKNKQKASSQTTKQVVAAYDARVLGTREWMKVPVPDAGSSQTLKNIASDRGYRAKGLYRLMLLHRELQKKRISFGKFVQLSNEYAHEYMCLRNQLTQTELLRRTGTYQKRYGDVAKGFKDQISKVQVCVYGVNTTIGAAGLEAFKKALGTKKVPVFLELLCGAMEPQTKGIRFVTPELDLHEPTKCTVLK